MMWFMDRTQRFPRNYRNTLTRWVEEQLWGILDLLIEAAYTRHKLPLLEQSNLRLQKLRFLARVCKDRQCLSQYEYAARTINALGTRWAGGSNNSTPDRLDIEGCAPKPYEKVDPWRGQR
jgi:hypothetical protein